MAGVLTLAEQERFEVDSYYAKSTSKTKANETLFVAYRDVKPPVPKDKRTAHAESLFSAIPGYVGVRQVRAMCFVDFDSIKASTSAMMRYQGHMGLTIDYDKDKGVASKRARESVEKTEKAQHAASSCNYYCACCGTKALRTNGALLSALPARGTDGARAVDEMAKLEHLLLEPLPSAQPVRVQRTKGIEKQWRLGCRSCGEWIAYRSAPAVAAGSYLYVLPDSVRERPLTHAEHEELQSTGSSGQEAAPSSGQQEMAMSSARTEADAIEEVSESRKKQALAH